MSDWWPVSFCVFCLAFWCFVFAGRHHRRKFKALEQLMTTLLVSGQDTEAFLCGDYQFYQQDSPSLVDKTEKLEDIFQGICNAAIELQTKLKKVEQDARTMSRRADRSERQNENLKEEIEILEAEETALQMRINLLCSKNKAFHKANKALKEEVAKGKEEKEAMISNYNRQLGEISEENSRLSWENAMLKGKCSELSNTMEKVATGDQRARLLMEKEAKIQELTSQMVLQDVEIHELKQRLRDANECLRWEMGQEGKRMRREAEIRELGSRLAEGEKRWRAVQEQKAKVVEHNRKLKAALKKVEHENRKLRESNFQLEQQVHVGLVERSKIIGGEVQFDGGGVQQTCVVCWNSPLNVMIFPCNHVCLCKKCSLKVEDACPICKAGIEDKVNVFIS